MNDIAEYLQLIRTNCTQKRNTLAQIVAEPERLELELIKEMIMIMNAMCVCVNAPCIGHVTVSY